MNVVFVGGIADGRREILPDGKMRHTFVKRDSLSSNLAAVEPTTPIIYEEHHYNLFRLHPVTRAVIFAHEALTPTQVMEKLLEGYKEP